MRSGDQAGASFVIGKLGAPWGVKGDLKIHSYSGEFAHFLSLRDVELVRPDQASSGASRPRRLKLKVVRIEDKAEFLTMAFEGYASPESARALTGMEIVVPREAAAPLRDNEWYVADLVGLALVSDGGRLATVASILDGGPEPWLEAQMPNGRKVIVPFRKEFVGEVDLESGRIELLAPWLLDE
jgi:16S rRNA processing protein RimM